MDTWDGRAPFLMLNALLLFELFIKAFRALHNFTYSGTLQLSLLLPVRMPCPFILLKYDKDSAIFSFAQFFLTAATAQPFSAFYLSIFFLLSFFRWSSIHLFFCTYLLTYSIIFVLLNYFLALLFSALPYIQFSYFLSFILSIAAFHPFFYFFFLPFFVILLYFTSLFHSFSLRKVFPGK